MLQEFHHRSSVRLPGRPTNSFLADPRIQPHFNIATRIGTADYKNTTLLIWCGAFALLIQIKSRTYEIGPLYHLPVSMYNLLYSEPRPVWY